MGKQRKIEILSVKETAFALEGGIYSTKLGIFKNSKGIKLTDIFDFDENILVKVSSLYGAREFFTDIPLNVGMVSYNDDSSFELSTDIDLEAKHIILMDRQIKFIPEHGIYVAKNNIVNPEIESICPNLLDNSILPFLIESIKESFSSVSEYKEKLYTLMEMGANNLYNETEIIDNSSYSDEDKEEILRKITYKYLM